MNDEFKKIIDELDVEIITLIARRIELELAYINDQKANSKELHLKTRAIETLDKAKLKGNSVGLRDEFIGDLYGLILAEMRLRKNH